MSQLTDLFRSPPNDYRAKPFWAWNGKLEEAELLRQSAYLHEMGFGGFFMHSRTGLQTQYLGEEWFKLTDACTQAAAAYQMEPWIYDEDRWPSGPAGGIVTEDARFRRKYLTLTAGDEPCEGTPLVTFAASVTGLHLKKGYRMVERDTPLASGETRLTFCVHTMRQMPTYNGYTDADRLNPAATERFLEVTHRQYAAQCKNFSDICGVFTDEPHRGMVFSDFSDTGEERCRSIPWTDDLPEAFEAAYGEALIPRLPELFLQLDGEGVSLLKWQYMQLLETLFITRYLMPIQKWAHENGKKTTGHFLHEDTLMAQAIPTGSLMRCYEYLDEPGIDNLTENNYAPWAVKQLSSVARQLGKTKTLSELYAATGWQMTFRDYKYITDWQILLGINVRCPHLAWYTMRGEAKRDYPASLLHQSTWYREYAALETYFARFGLIASQGEPVCDTLVLHPVESLWYRIHPNWANGLEALDPSIIKLERRFKQLFSWLMQTQTDFDYGDEGILAEHAAVETQDGAALRVGRMRYRRVVVGGCESLRESTLALLRAFSSAGGEVVFIGTPPQYVAGVRSAACGAGNLRAVYLPMKKAEVLRYFGATEKAVYLSSPSAAEHIYMQLRQTENGLLALLWNKSRSKRLDAVELCVPQGLHVELWDCASGERYALAAKNGRVELSFDAGQERVLYLTETPTAVMAPPAPLRGEPLRLSAPTAYRTDEPNVYVLDRATLWAGNETVKEDDEILSLDRLLREKLGFDPRGGEMLQPWARKQADTFASIRLRYRVRIATQFDKEILLAMEDMPAQKLFVNGREVVPEKTDLRWVDSCFSVYAVGAEVWKTGENTIELTADYSADCGLEAMYLLGDFGVYFRGGEPTIDARPQTVKIGDLTRQGLPFYGGKVFYSFKLPRRGTFRVPYPKVGASCVAVTCGGERKLMLWSGQEVVISGEAGDEAVFETVGNRRNTFGPLHRFPRKQPYVAPDCFGCEDASRYCLYPSGLLAAPALYPSEE